MLATCTPSCANSAAQTSENASSAAFDARYAEKNGPRIITPETKAEMKRVLKDIQEGRFVKDFMLDNAAGNPELKSHRLIEGEHPIEEVGAKLRGLMPWMKEGQLVDKAKN